MIDRERLKARFEEAQGGLGDYNVNHSLVEKRIKATVGMAKEMEVQNSIRSKLLEKPAVARVHAEKVLAEKGRDKFYGPNLPVAWGDDLLPDRKEILEKQGKRKGKVVNDDDSDDDSEDSPTEDVRTHQLPIII